MVSFGRNDFNSHQLPRMGQKKIFHELDVHHAHIVVIKPFWAQEAKMSLSHHLVRIGEKKIFDELDVHHV